MTAGGASLKDPFLADSPMSVQQGENSGEADAFIVEARLALPFPPFLSTKTKRPAIVKDNSTNDCVKKEGLHQLHGPHCHQAT